MVSILYVYYRTLINVISPLLSMSLRPVLFFPGAGVLCYNRNRGANAFLFSCGDICEALEGSEAKPSLVRVSPPSK